MGRRGPAPRPTALKVLHGEKKSRINKTEPVPRQALPGLPDDLSEAEVAVWERVVPELAAMGLAFAADTDIIRTFCSAVVAHDQAARLVFTAGVIIRGRDQKIVRNPAVTVMRQQADAVRMLARELGLSPAARVNFGSLTEPEQDVAARLLSS